MELVGVIVVLVLVLMVGPLVLSAMARHQVDLVIPAPPEQVGAEVEAVMNGIWWREVHGEGTLNYEVKGMGISSMAIKTKPVISVSLFDRGQDGTGVGIWMSEFGSAWGQVGCADRVVFKRRKLIRRLRALHPVPGGPVMASAAQSTTGSVGGQPAGTLGLGGASHSSGPGIQAMPGAGIGSNIGGSPTPTFGPGAGRPGGGHAPVPPGYGGQSHVGAPPGNAGRPEQGASPGRGGHPGGPQAPGAQPLNGVLPGYGAPQGYGVQPGYGAPGYGAQPGTGAPRQGSAPSNAAHPGQISGPGGDGLYGVRPPDRHPPAGYPSRH